MMRIYFISILFLFSGGFFLLYSQNSLLTVDLTNARQENILMSSVFDHVEYISLETHPDALLRPKTRYFVTDKYIVAVDVFRKTYLFDRRSGKYLRQIGQEGGGPEEYRRFMLFFNPLDERNNIIYAHDVTRFKGYDIETGKLKTIINYNPNGTYFWSLGNDKYIVSISNNTGQEPFIACVFDRNGAVLRTYPNYSFYNPELYFSDDKPATRVALFYNLNGKLYLTPYFLGDTAYLVTDKVLIPHFVIRTGNRLHAKTKEENAMANKKNLHFVRETSRYIFFNYGMGHYAFGLYSGYYDKKNKQTYIASASQYSRDFGFLNDIDGFPPFTPRHINEKQEVIGRIIPEEILEHVERNGFSSLSPRAKELVKNMQEDDNPIVVIAQPKK